MLDGVPGTRTGAALPACAYDGAALTLVVHDWGGMIGMAWAAKHRDRIARLVVMNTAAFPNPKGQKLPLALRLIRNTPLGPGLVLGLNAFARGATRMAVTRRPMAPALDA